MSQEDSAQLKKKIGHGVMSLSLRTIVVNILQVISSLILANFLSPGDYGIFGIFAGWIGTLIFFTDFGIGQTLVLQKEKLSQDQVATYLGLRLTLALIMMALFFLCYPFILRYYDIKFEHSHLLVFYVGVLIFEALSSVPRLFFHKELEFNNLAKIDLTGSIVLYLVQILMAITGFHFWSFFAASVARWALSTFVGISLLKEKYPSPKLKIKIFAGKYLLAFKYHLNGLVPVTKSILLPMVMAKAFDVEDIGLIFWLTNMVSLPKALFQNYNHVLFASLARVADDQEEFKKIATESSSIAIYATLIIFGFGAILGPDLIKILFSHKFQDAGLYIHLTSFAIGLSVLEFIHLPILTSTGKPGLVNRAQAASFIIDIIATYFLSIHFGIKGYFIGQIIIFLMTGSLFHLYSKKYFSSIFYRRLIVVGICIVLLSVIPDFQNHLINVVVKSSVMPIFLGFYMFLFDKELVSGLLGYFKLKRS